MVAQTSPTIFVVDPDNTVWARIADHAAALGLNVDCFSWAEQFLDTYEPEFAGCLVSEFQLPAMSGLQLQTALAERAATIPVVFLSLPRHTSLADIAKQAGAFAVLEKPCPEASLRAALRDSLIQDDTNRRNLQRDVGICQDLVDLTEIEQAVLRSRLTGEPTDKIANRLHVEPQEAEAAWHRAFRKIGASHHR